MQEVGDGRLGVVLDLQVLVKDDEYGDREEKRDISQGNDIKDGPDVRSYSSECVRIWKCRVRHTGSRVELGVRVLCPSSANRMVEPASV